MITGQFEPGANADIEHIALASSIDLLLVAPATANIIGKFASGIADDFLSSLYLATRAPVLARARHEHEHVGARGGAAEPRRSWPRAASRIVEPGEGFLACGWTGKGRLAEPDGHRGRRRAACCGRSQTLAGTTRAS